MLQEVFNQSDLIVHTVSPWYAIAKRAFGVYNSITGERYFVKPSYKGWQVYHGVGDKTTLLYRKYFRYKEAKLFLQEYLGLVDIQYYV